MRRRMKIRVAAAVGVLTTTLGAGCGTSTGDGIAADSTGQAGDGQLADGCARAEEPIELPTQYTAYDDMMSHPMPQYIKAEPPTDDRLSALGLPSTLGGLPAAGVQSEPDRPGGQFGNVFYVDGDPSGLTIPQVKDKGAIMVSVQQSEESEDLLGLTKMFPERMVSVQVADHPGLMYHSDEDASRARSYAVVWVDGAQTFWVYERQGPAATLNAARDIACGRGG